MKTKKLVLSAVFIGIAAILSIIQPFHLPFGGGVTFASMTPIILISYMFGLRHGLFTGFVYSLVQIATGINVVAAFFLPGDNQLTLPVAIGVCLLDYIVAYTILGIGGVFKGKFKNTTLEICLGSVLALIARYFVHILSGALFFGTWAEWFFTQDGFYAIGENIINTFSGVGLSVIYSIFYNGLYMIPEIIITVIVTPVVYRVISKSNIL